MKYFKYTLPLLLIATSCDPGGTSFLRNQSDDTLSIEIVFKIPDPDDAWMNFRCIDFYDSIFFYDGILHKKELREFYHLMEFKIPETKNDTLIEIRIPAQTTIVTNHGLMASSLLPHCDIKYATFSLAGRSDTIFIGSSPDFSSLREFYKNNKVKLIKNNKFMWYCNITDVYAIK